MRKSVVLKPKREHSIKRQHPWVYSGAVREVRGDPALGETVEVLDSAGSFLARGAYSPHSQIAVRLWTWDEAEEITAGFFAARLDRAIAVRERLLQLTGAPARQSQVAYRLVNAESDGLPGLVVDRYGDFLVFQFLSAGAGLWKPVIVQALAATARLGARGGYERSDVDVREKEGLPLAIGLLFGEEPPALVEIEEGGARCRVDVRHGQKTGYYLDQRENRRIVKGLAHGCEVLNAFAYTGSFGVAALLGGAVHVTNVDTSGAALDLARQSCHLNGLGDDQCEQVEGDVFQVLRQYRDAARSFDLIVLDPPKFAHSAGQVQKAARAYKDINLLALKLLRPAGVLVTFSCSGAVSADLFQKIVFAAALDAGRPAQILGRLTQSPDHPVLLSFPEAQYLKGLILRVP